MCISTRSLGSNEITIGTAGKKEWKIIINFFSRKQKNGMHLLIVYYSAKKTVKRQKLEVLTSLWLEVWETYGIDGL